MIIAEQFSQSQTSRSEGARQITARFESAQMKNTSLISACSTVDVPMPSYGASDEHPMSTRSASDERRWNSRGWKYVACMLMILCLGTGEMWADVAIMDYTEGTGPTTILKQGNFYTSNGVSISTGSTRSEDGDNPAPVNGISFSGRNGTKSTYYIYMAGSDSIRRLVVYFYVSNKEKTATLVRKDGTTIAAKDSSIVKRAVGAKDQADSIVVTGSLVKGVIYTLTMSGNEKLYGARVEHGYKVDHVLTNATKTSGATLCAGSADYTAVYSAADGYSLPTSVTVMRGSTNISASCTWVQATGTLTIPDDEFTGGNIKVTVTGESAALACSEPTSPSISGTTSYTAGGTISLTASATGTDESTTYQWYKGDPADSGVSQGDASTDGATFSKASCVVADAGTYYCVISNGAGCEVTTDQAITVAKASMPSTGLAVGEATSITASGATLPFTMTSTSGVGSLTIKVYKNSDNSLVKTISNITPATSGSQAVTGLSASTTYYYTITPIGDANHNDGDETSASSTFTTDAPACEAPTSPSISGTTSYTAGEDIELTASATGTDGSTTYQWYKGDPANSGVSQGDASTDGATFTIDGCEVADAGTYYCVISNGAGCEVTTYQAITVAKADMPSTGLATGTATSITTSGATLPFTMSSTTGVGSLTIKVYKNSDNSLVETISNVTADASGSAEVTGLDAGTTYYYTITPIGDANHNDGSETSASSPFTTETVAYSVTYAANGGSGDVPTDANTYSPNAEVTVLGKNTLSKSGYTFCGWSYNGYVYVAGDKFEITENATLTAVWNQNATTVTITDFATSNTNTSNNIPDNNSKYFYGYKGTVSDAYALTLTSNDGNDRGQNSGVEMRLTYNKKMRVYANNTTNAAPATFTGVTAISFKWKFIASGNSGKTELTSSYTVKVGSTTVADGVSITGKTNDGYATVNITGLASLNGYVEILFGGSSASYNVYLDDIAITYSASTYKKVTFNKGSGPSTVSGLPADRYVPSGSKISRPSTDPTATGYIFNGWVTESGGSTSFDFANTTITTDKTIYAKWTAKTSPGSGTVSGTTSICSGSNTNVTLSTSVSGASYQLYKDNVASGEPKPGTSSALNWSVSAAGTYTVKAVETATHASGDMSGSATISIYTALSKTSDPTSSKSATVGVGCALDGLAYTGNANVACQWQSCTDATPSSASNISDGGAYSNCTTPAMTFTPASAGTYYFRCVVSDDCGSSFNSGVVTVTAKVSPTVYSLSGEPTALCGGTATLTLSGSDDGVTYKLYKGGVDQSDDKVGDGNEIEWTGIDAAGTYTVKTVETSTYAEATMTGSISITIMTPTSISTQPTTSVTAHDGVNFTLGSDLVGAGEGTLTYQWYSYTGSDGAGEATVGSATTTKTLTTSKSAGTYYYKVEVIGECGSDKSNMITVTVDNKHYLTYSANNGSGAPTGDYYAPSASVTLNSTTIPTRSGYVFLGWNTNSSGTGDMYQPGATYTMPATATTLYAAWGSPCFSFSKGTKGTEPTDGFVMTPENINSSAFNSGATLSGGNMTNTSGATLGINGSRGFVMIKSTRELTLTLTGGQFQEGTVITLEGYTNNENSKSYGFALGTVKVGGTKSTESTGDYTLFSQRYVVVADDGIEGTSSVVVKMNGDCTGSQTYLSAIKIGGCFSCTSISPSLSYDKTTIWVGESDATPSLNKDGSTGSVTYVSNNTDVATVNESTGVITAVARGTATITATIAADATHCGKSTTCDITVKDMTCGITTIAKATRSGTSASYSGVEGGSALVNNLDGSNYKLKSGGYVGVQLPSTLSFEAGDTVRIDLTIGDWWNSNKADELPVVVYADNTGTNEIYRTDNYTQLTAQVVEFEVTSSMLTALATKQVTVYRQSSTETQNHVVNSVEVKRNACADVYYFNDKSKSGEWSDEENWLGPAGQAGGLPTIDDRVVINKPMTVDVPNAKAKEIILDQSSDNEGKLTITAGNALLIAETLAKTTDGETKVATEAADVIINSTRATGVGALIIGGETGTNAATMNFETKAKNDGGWVNQFVGSPFSNNTPYVDYALQLYKFVPQANGDRGWWQTHTSGTMTPFWGYNVLYNDNNYLDVTWTGTLNVSESKMISDLYYNGSSETDNMFANSWTAPIHVGAIEDADLVNASKTLYMFNAGTPDQEEGNDGSNAANNNTAPGTYISIPIHTATYAGIGVIPSMQAFYVLATGSGASITLDYNKVVYTPALTSVGIVPNRAPRRSVAADEPEVIKLRVQSESGWAANTYVMGRADFAESYEDGWDGAYIEGESATPKLYTPSIDGNMFINCLPEIEGTVVGFRKGTEDNYYTCSFEYNGEDTWYLNDLKEQKSTLINAAETYEFVAEPGDTETRFVISATPIHKITTGNESVGAEAAKVRKLIIDDKVYIIRGGRMYSVDGQMIK